MSPAAVAFPTVLLLAAVSPPIGVWAIVGGVGILTEGQSLLTQEHRLFFPPVCGAALTQFTGTVALVRWTDGDIITLRGRDGDGPVEASTSGTPPTATITWVSGATCPRDLRIIGTKVATEAAYTFVVHPISPAQR